MRMMNQWMVVKFDRPSAKKLESGLYLVPANINAQQKGEDSQRLEGEWWPEIGTVLLPPKCHISMRPTKNTMVAPGGKEVQIMENYQTSWRVPKRGDKVVFGFKDVNVSKLDIKGRIILDVSKAAYVIPADGSGPYAMGEWCVLEQIPKTIYEGGFISSFTQKYEHGVGVVRFVSDGFLEKHPSAGPGKIIKYVCASNRNPECPNYIGDYMMTRIKPSVVTGIDHSGINEEELAMLKNEASELNGIKESISGGIASHKSGTAIQIHPGMTELEKAEIKAYNEKIHLERAAESRDRAFREAAKQQKKKMLGSNRKYF